MADKWMGGGRSEVVGKLGAVENTRYRLAIVDSMTHIYTTVFVSDMHLVRVFEARYL